MKRNLTWIGIIIMLAFSLSMFTGCAGKKSIVKEGAAQDQQLASDQAEKDAAAAKETKEAADRLVKEQADRDAADRLAKEQAEKEQSAKVEAAAAAEVATAKASAAEAAVKDIYFDFDQSNISPDAREILKANAEYFLKNSAAEITVEGNCDERGTAEYNMALGQRRAQEAKKYLVNLGVKESKIKTISYGKEKPIDAGHDEQAWAKNRRDHFVVTVK